MGGLTLVPRHIRFGRAIDLLRSVMKSATMGCDGGVGLVDTIASGAGLAAIDMRP